MLNITLLWRLLFMGGLVAAFALTSGGGSAAAREPLGLPFDPGETWEVVQGYKSSHTHVANGLNRYALDLKRVNCGVGCDSGNEQIRASFTGTVVRSNDFGTGCAVIVQGDGKRLMYIHLNYHPSVGLCETVTVGQIVNKGAPIGTVWPGFAPSNVNHLHIQWCVGANQDPNFPNGFAGCAAADQAEPLTDGIFCFPEGGPDGGNGQWSGYQIPPGNCNGCSDSDGDGVCDDIDQCPNTPPSTPVDPQGCPINQPPTADADGPYTTDEGQNEPLDGTGSSDPNPGDTLSYAWDLDNDGQFDDSTSATPAFTRVGQDGVFTVRLRVSDGVETDTDSTTVTVNNVAPSVSLSSNAPKDEGSAVTVSGTVTDPGWLDPLTATIDWGDGTPPVPVGGTLENVRPDATLTFSIAHVYGDNGTFTAEVCASDDDTTTCKTIALQIDNVDPTAEIDMSGAILINGVPTFMASIGDPLNFTGNSTDPGSDDLTLRWDWDDGSPFTETTYLVNPPNPDPFPSPSIQPRDVTDAQGHTYTDACLYEIKFWAVDDDGGTSAVDTANVIIVGNAEQTRSAGYWLHQFRTYLTDRGRPHFDAPTLGCYLDIAGYMSQVFDEERDASTFELAHDVLFVKNNSGDMTEMFDQQLLATWLNFANGSIEYDELVDTDGDGVADTAFADAMAAAEAVRLDPTSTRSELEAQKEILEALNLMG